MYNLKKLYLLFFSFHILIYLFLSIHLYSNQNKYLEQQYYFLFTQAEKFRKKGDFIKSIEFFENTLSTAIKISSKEKECDSLIKLGLLHWNIGKLKQSKEFYSKALRLIKKYNLKYKAEECESSIQIYELYTQAKEHRSSGRYQESIANFQKAISIAKKIRSKEHEIKCLRQLSATYWNTFDLQKFFILNNEGLKISRELNHKEEEGKCMNNIGVYYMQLGYYSKSLVIFENALKLAESENQKENISERFNNLGIIYSEIGLYEKSIDYLLKALNIDRELGDNLYVSMDLNNIGEILRKKGLVSRKKEDFYNALEYFKECHLIVKNIGDTKMEVKVLNNIGSVHSHLENYDEALKYFRLGYEKAEEIYDAEAMGMILNNIGIVHYNLGNYEESTKYYQKAIDLALGIKGGQILWEAYLELANAFTKQNKFEEALENYKNSISIIEDIRSQIELEELKASYLGTDKRIIAYHNLIDLLATLHGANPNKGYNLEAFNYLERAKARAFLDSLEISRVDISQNVDTKLMNEERELMKDISNLYTKLLASKLSQQEKDEIHEELKNYENRLEALKREIRTESPAYADLKYPEIITVEETQEDILDKKTSIFAYSIGKDNSYLFVITKKDLKIFPIPARDELQKQVSNYLKIISDKDNHDFNLGHMLFQCLVLPGLENGMENLVLIPDDILHFLPFEALITDRKKNEWLIQEYKISYTPSISSYREIIQHKKANSKNPHLDILAFGDPNFGFLESEENGGDIFQNFFSSTAFNFSRLEYSGYEIQRINSLFKKTKSRVFQRENASEEHLKGHNLKDYKIIHFATHSLIDDKRPARSSIVLSLDEDPQEDGFLQMREVYNLKLNADLIVLSACQTGLGQFIKGEGIEGLNRAFFFAGASSVLMSLWSVNDQASSQLMERFYHHLRSSESIANALRKTKLEMMSSEILSHPFYWAGFIVSGKADEVIFPNPFYKWPLLVFSILLGSIITIIIVKRFIS